MVQDFAKIYSTLGLGKGMFRLPVPTFNQAHRQYRDCCFPAGIPEAPC